MGERSQGSSSVRTWGDLAVAVGAGLLLGILVMLQPVISIALIVALLGLAVLGLVRGDSRQALLAAGALVGSGAVYLYGAIGTTLACLDDRLRGGRSIAARAVRGRRVRARARDRRELAAATRMIPWL
jgi:hypothetical protein